MTRDTEVGAVENPVSKLWHDMRAVQQTLAQSSSVDTTALAARIHRWQEALEELAALQQFDRELKGSLDFAEILQRTLSWALRATAAQAGVLSVLDVENRLQTVASSTNGITPTPTEKKLVTRTMESAEPVVFGGSRILAPIRRDGQAIGVLDLQSSDGSQFELEHARLASQVADRAAVAIENARLYEEARRANQAQSAFISFVTHELRTPLTSIRGYASLLGNEMVGSLSPRQEECAQAIQRNVDRMKVLVSDLQDISQIEAGQLRLEEKPVLFKAALREAYQTVENQIEYRSQKLRLDIPDDLPEVLADPTYLAKILGNVLSHACKYTSEGGDIGVQARCAGGCVQCRITEQGLGVSQEDQTQPVATFTRSDSQTGRAVLPTELGLWIAKNLVEMQGGEMKTESQQGRDAAVTFTLPIA